MDHDDEAYLMDLAQKIAAVNGHVRARDEKIVSMLRYERATISEIQGATGLSAARIEEIVSSAS